MRAPLDSSKDSSNNSVTGREPKTTPAHLFSDDPSYQLFIHMLINFGIRELPEGLIDGLDRSMQTEINTIIEKINEFYEAKEAYQARKTVEEPDGKGKEKDTDGIVASEKYHSFLVRGYSISTFLRKKAGVKILEFPSLFNLTAEWVKRKQLVLSVEKVSDDVVEKAALNPFKKEHRLSAYSDSSKAKYTEFAKRYFSLLIDSIRRADYTLTSAEGHRLFNIASAFGTVPILKAFVARGVDPTATDSRQETALFYACNNEDLSCLRYLLSQKKIDITATNSDNQTCLHYAAELDSVKHGQVFLEFLGNNEFSVPINYYNPFTLDARYNSAARIWRLVHSDKELALEREGLFVRDRRIRSSLSSWEENAPNFLRNVKESYASHRKPYLFSLACLFIFTALVGGAEITGIIISLAEEGNLDFSKLMVSFIPGLSGMAFMALSTIVCRIEWVRFKHRELERLENDSRQFDWADADIAADKSVPQERDIENQNPLAEEGPSGWDDQSEEDESSLLLNNFG